MPATPLLPASLRHRLENSRSLFIQLWPGFAVATLLAMAATFVSAAYGGPQLMYALFFGMALHHLSADARSKPGLEFCARTLLRVGVGLLGARITATQILELGWGMAAVVVAGVVSTLGLAILLGRCFGLNRPQSVLAGGAVAICGASAALALSAVLPRHQNSERFTLTVVVSVTVLSTIAMVLYPVVAQLLQLPPELAGLLLGGTIHDVAQVVGAGYTLSPQAGDVATTVKLFRVALLTVVVGGVALAFREARMNSAQDSVLQGSDTRPKSPPLVPWFLWVFVAMVALNSLGGLPSAAQESLNTVSRTCLVLAIAALGVKTSLASLAKAGWGPLMLIVVETLWLFGWVLACVSFMR